MRWHGALVMYVAWTVAAVPAAARLPTDAAREPDVTVTGCVQRESDSRRVLDAAGGALTVIGGEFVLINASSMITTLPVTGNPSSFTSTPGSTRSARSVAGAVELAPGGSSATGVAYRLTGTHERDAAQYLGKWVEAVGKVRAPGAEGSEDRGLLEPGLRPDETWELNLLEFEPTSFRMLSGACAVQ